MYANDQDAYVELRVDVPRELTDTVCDFIIQHIATGLVLEEEENETNTGILFYLQPEKRERSIAQLNEFLSEHLGTADGGKPAVSERPIKSVEWVEQYKKSVVPILVGNDICVRPPWADAPTGVSHDIVIEPKMAFGTGQHETTRSCLKLIKEQLEPGGRFLDMGCGSGILAILAAQIGVSYIKAVDYDPLSVENTEENLIANKITTPHEVLLGSIEQCHGDTPYQFICVNIIKSAILEMFDSLRPLLAPDGIMLLSGLLAQDETDISAVLNRAGVTDFSIYHDNEWITYTVRNRA